ncbi:hypothetical protein Bbelb_220320 [Branchiostoma belcheri]|nr:hypothetical protein Bbelb_220320 [Branchiostoma belcheri]
MASPTGMGDDDEHSYEDIDSRMEDEDEHSYEDVDSQAYNYIDHDDILNELQTGEQTSAGTPPVAAGHNIADPLGNAIQPKDGDSIIANIWGRLKSYKCPRPSLLRVIAIAVPVVALLGTGACVGMYLAFTGNKHGEAANPPVKESPNGRTVKDDSCTGLAGDYPTGQHNWTVTDGRHTAGPFALQHQKETVLTTERHLPFGRPPTFHGNTFDDTIHVPRCKKGYRLLAGTCIKLGPTGWLEIARSHDGAKKACMTEGSTLAMPKTEELDVALRDLVKREGGNHQHWIGMEKKKGTWYWVDGSKVGNNGYKGWTPGQPSNPRWPPLCGQYWAKSGYPMWDDDACLNLRRFICQRPPA